MSIMVTGGSGFIGVRVVRKLLERGEKVVCFDVSPPRSQFHSMLERGTFYRGDVTQITQLLEATKTFDVRRVIHLAAMVPPETEDKPHPAMYLNIQGTNNVFEVARWAGLERVVYASSLAYYGLQENFGLRAVNEDDRPNPINIYGMTKLANEFAARKYTERCGLDLRGIRICPTLGHGRTAGPAGPVIGLLISYPAVGKPIDIPFSAAQPYLMIHVEDAAEIFVRVALADGLRHPVYNTGGYQIRIGDIAELVKEFIPDARITMGSRPAPGMYLVENSRLMTDVDYVLPPLRVRILDHINEARSEAGLQPIKG
ncbi:MAG: NAD(P)-dependent oxidoreductase [Chloroflexi bacterium]|nr:NAD(P)-dependent oxidoreductase [Chloroflexota bacterium]